VTSFARLWAELLPIGRDRRSGGYRRFAWTPADLACREWFAATAAARGLDTEVDRNGNLWAWWLPSGFAGEPRGALVTGSHLDSVPDGGAYDGPLGVVSAFAALDELAADGITPSVPIAVVAFADEEGGRFGVACAGSRLLTGVLDPDRARALADRDGITMADAMAVAGHDPARLGRDTEALARIGTFVELHIEQGRALIDLGEPLGLAGSIWPHGRWRLTVTGAADHAGTTRLVDRHDAMVVAAAAVLAARRLAGRHGAVATVGKIEVEPNGVNAIPSRVRAWLDVRAPDEATLRGVIAEIGAEVWRAAELEGATAALTDESMTPLVRFGAEPRRRLDALLGGGLPVLPTAAGHDAGVLAAEVPTAMIFVRNPTGISHSPAEHAEQADCEAGVAALATVLRAAPRRPAPSPRPPG
jgi:N-carbamoyl-L-amino-acid hydrolase